MRTLFVVAALALSACGAAPTNDSPDAALSNAPDAGACMSSGDGSQGAQCCVWSSAPCTTGLTCVWSGGNQNHGYCDRAGSTATGSACPATGDCEAGDYCVPGDFGPSVCRALCVPGSSTCAAGMVCSPSGDETVGVCIP